MAIITYPLNGIDFDAENAETYLCTRTSGVYSADDHFALEITGERSVSISPGLAWIKNDRFYGKSVCSDESVELAVPIADGARGRIDRVVLRFVKAVNGSELAVKRGTPASSPVPPDVQQDNTVYELGLYTINVPAGSVAVTDSDITDTRMDETVCGLMRDGVTRVPTQQLYTQYSAMLDQLAQKLVDVEGGTAFMLRSAYDPAGTVAQAGGIPAWAAPRDALRSVTVAIAATDWQGASEPYSCTKSVQGMTEDWVPAWRKADLQSDTLDAADISAAATALGLIQYIESSAGALTFICPGNKPEVDLTVTIGGALT